MTIFMIKRRRYEWERKKREVMSLEAGYTEVLFCYKGRIRWLRRKRKEEGGKVARCYSWGFNVFQRHILKVRLSFWFFSAVLTLCLWMWLWTGWAKMPRGIYSYNLPPHFQENMPKPSIFHQKYHWSGSIISRGSWLPTVVVFELCSQDHHEFQKSIWGLIKRLVEWEKRCESAESSVHHLTLNRSCSTLSSIQNFA